MHGEPKQTARPVKFWDCHEHQELLSHTTIGDAVEDWADSTHPTPLPETVTVYGWAEMELPSEQRIADDVLYDLLERLDEEYGDQVNGGPTEITPALKAAALAFAREVRKHYPVWTCEQVAKEVVRVADYVPAEWMNRPESANA